MKKLLSTTALVVTLGFPTLTLAQETQTAAGDDATMQSNNSATAQQDAEMTGFLTERSQSDLFASDLLGHDVHARRGPGDASASSYRASENGDETRAMGTMNSADLDEMENIGEINEIVLASDGQVRAFVISVGGFLGMGEHDVAVTMDQITVASDADDPSQTYVVINSGADMLKDAPAYDRTGTMADSAEVDDQNERTEAKAEVVEDDEQTERSAANTDAAKDDEQTERSAANTDAAEGDEQTERMAFAAPEMEREGYERVKGNEVSTEMLMGKSVYDVNDNDVGTVTDLIIDDGGNGMSVVVDFGGFLGLGSSQVVIDYDELTFLISGEDDVRLYVDASKGEIQNRQKRASN